LFRFVHVLVDDPLKEGVAWEVLHHDEHVLRVLERTVNLNHPTRVTAPLR
jgi:hypothetical protein